MVGRDMFRPPAVIRVPLVTASHLFRQGLQSPSRRLGCLWTFNAERHGMTRASLPPSPNPEPSPNRRVSFFNKLRKLMTREEQELMVALYQQYRARWAVPIIKPIHLPPPDIPHSLTLEGPTLE